MGAFEPVEEGAGRFRWTAMFCAKGVAAGSDDVVTVPIRCVSEEGVSVVSLPCEEGDPAAAIDGDTVGEG